MNPRIDELMYRSGLTAQGCWDNMDEYDRTAVLKFAELIVRECADVIEQDWHVSSGELLELMGYNRD
jgi:hypothetical protein